MSRTSQTSNFLTSPQRSKLNRNEKPLSPRPLSMGNFGNNTQLRPIHAQARSRRTKAVMLTIFSGVFCWLITSGPTPYLSPNNSAGKQVLANTCSSREFDWYALTPSENILWTPCFGDKRCARLSLPLDYLTPEGPKTEIALLMKPATNKKNYKGSILINPGGPGGSGTQTVEWKGQDFSKVVGPEYDIIGFDPRGTGATTPQAQCFDSESQRKVWDLQDGVLINPSDGSLSRARSREAAVSLRCLKALGGNGEELINGTAQEWGPGRFMSTWSVATDMVQIIDKLGQEKLHYWGLSYGTILGQYFAALYPEKVGRVILDGVADATIYRSAGFSRIGDIEDVYNAFFTFCHRGGPESCPLYAPTVAEIRSHVFGILDSVSESPIPIPFTSNGPALVTKKVLYQQMFTSTFAPLIFFKPLADILVAIKQKNQTALAQLLGHLLSYKCSCSDSIPWLRENEAFNAIACSDSAWDRSPEEFQAVLSRMLVESPLAASLWAAKRLKCAEWKITAKTRYTGPLSANNTADPILIISNKFDNVCPLREAKEVQKRFKGSALLVQNSFGHCSPSSPSLCTAKAVRAYFADGTLPHQGATCDVNELPFVGNVDDTVGAYSENDRELLAAWRNLGDAIPKFGGF